jgi:hypothetical protein
MAYVAQRCEKNYVRFLELSEYGAGGHSEV